MGGNLSLLKEETLLKLTFDDGTEWVADVKNQIIATQDGVFCAKFSEPIPGQRFSYSVGECTVVYFRKVLKVATV